MASKIICIALLIISIRSNAFDSFNTEFYYKPEMGQPEFYSLQVSRNKSYINGNTISNHFLLTNRAEINLLLLTTPHDGKIFCTGGYFVHKIKRSKFASEQRGCLNNSSLQKLHLIYKKLGFIATIGDEKKVEGSK